MKKLVLNPKPPTFTALNGEPGTECTLRGIWRCGECGGLRPTEEHAKNCCLKQPCIRCGKPPEEDYHLLCSICRVIDKAEREQEEWAKMPEVEYDGTSPVCVNDCFYDNLEELLGEREGEDNLPAYVEMCKIEKIGFNIKPECIIEDIEERALEDIQEGFNITMCYKDELELDLKKFLEKQTKTIFVPQQKKINVEKYRSGVEVSAARRHV